VTVLEPTKTTTHEFPHPGYNAVRNNSEDLVRINSSGLACVVSVASLARIYLPLSGTHKISARSIALRRACAVPAAVIALHQHQHYLPLLLLNYRVLRILYSVL
jgi:hypothetical protein